MGGRALPLWFAQNGSVVDCLSKEPEGPLAKLLRTEAGFLKFLQAVLLGVAHLHDHGVVHRDIAARNVLVDAMLAPKVGDFGLSFKEGVKSWKQHTAHVSEVWLCAPLSCLAESAAAQFAGA